MGVPVLTLAGKTFLSRQGTGLLMNAGLPERIAADADDFVARAVARARDGDSLAAAGPPGVNHGTSQQQAGIPGGRNGKEPCSGLPRAMEDNGWGGRIRTLECRHQNRRKMGKR